MEKRLSSSKRQKRLLDLALEGALGRQEQVLRHLLGDRRAALHHLVGLQVGRERAESAEDVDAAVLEEAPVLGGERRLDHASGISSSGTASLCRMPRLPISLPLLVEEFDGELAGEELALVELLERRKGEREHDDEAAGAERQPFGGRLVEQALPAGELEAGEKARAGIPDIAKPRPCLGER